MAHRKLAEPQPAGDPAEVVALDVAMVSGGLALAEMHPAIAIAIALGAPFAKKLAMLGTAIWSSSAGAEKRLDRIRVAGGFDDLDLDEDFAKKLTNEDTFLYSTVEAALLDDEALKAWAYGALLRAFRDDAVGHADRARWLRFVKEYFNVDLLAVVHAGQRATKCRKFHDGKENTARLIEELASHGFETHEDVAWYEQTRLAAAMVKGNRHLQQQLENYGLLTEHPALSELYFSRLHDVLLAGAQRAELAEAHQTDEAFLELMVGARRERETWPARVRDEGKTFVE